MMLNIHTIFIIIQQFYKKQNNLINWTFILIFCASHVIKNIKKKNMPHRLNGLGGKFLIGQ